MNDVKARIPLFFFLALLLISAVYYSLVYMPMQKEIDGIKLQRQTAEQQIQLYAQYASNIDTLKSDVATLNTELIAAQSQKYRVNAHNLPEDVQAAIAASGIALMGLQIDVPQMIDSSGNFGIYQLPVTVNFQCANVNQAFTLLNYFEQSTDSSFYVKSISTDDMKQSFGVRLSLLLYYPEAMGNAA